MHATATRSCLLSPAAVYINVLHLQTATNCRAPAPTHLHLVQQPADLLAHPLRIGLKGHLQKGLVALLHQLRGVLGPQPAQQAARHGCRRRRRLGTCRAKAGGRVSEAVAAAAAAAAGSRKG